MDDQQRLRRNGIKVDSLYRTVRDSQAVELVPQLVRQIIADNMWREHTYDKTNQTFRFDKFQTFVEKHPPDGLGTKVEVLFKLCLEDATVIEMIDKALETVGEAKDGNEPQIKRPAVSSSRQAGLRRLRQYSEQNDEVAKLRQAVLAGEMSVNAALVAAGLRKPRITIPKDLTKATQALKRIYNHEEIQQLIKSMSDTDELTTAD
ncbi:MAG: hypothetical protein ACRYFS_06270 [Janthinobacterium lividum]